MKKLFVLIVALLLILPLVMAEPSEDAAKAKLEGYFTKVMGLITWAAEFFFVVLLAKAGLAVAKTENPDEKRQQAYKIVGIVVGMVLVYFAVDIIALLKPSV